MPIFRYESHTRRIEKFARFPQVQAGQPWHSHEHTPSDYEDQRLNFEIVIVPLVDFRQLLPEALDVPRVE